MGSGLGQGLKWGPHPLLRLPQSRLHLPCISRNQIDDLNRFCAFHKLPEGMRRTLREYAHEHYEVLPAEHRKPKPKPNPNPNPNPDPIPNPNPNPDQDDAYGDRMECLDEELRSLVARLGLGLG